MKIKISSCVVGSALLAVLLSLLLPTVSFGGFNASLVWSDTDDKHKQIYFSRYTNAGGTWSVPLKLTKSKEHDTFPDVCTGKDGHDWVVWSRKQEGKLVLMYMTSSDDVWSKPVMIDTGLSLNNAVSLAIDQNNIPWLVWVGFDGTDDEIYWSRWEGKAWSQAERVASENSVPDLLPVLSIDKNNVLTAEWQSLVGANYETVSRSYVDNKWQKAVKRSIKRVRKGSVVPGLIRYPQLPEFVPDYARPNMHVQRVRK